MKLLDFLIWIIGLDEKAPPSKPATKPIQQPEPVQGDEPDWPDEDSDFFFDEFME